MPPVYVAQNKKETRVQQQQLSPSYVSTMYKMYAFRAIVIALVSRNTFSSDM